jgi:biotin transport system ATP-binding protein
VQQVLGQIVGLHEHGHTVVVTTHDVEKVIAHAGRLVVLKNGKVVRNGHPSKTLRGIETLGVREPCASRLGLEVTSWLN